MFLPTEQDKECVGRSARGRCTALPRFSVSEHLDQRTDYRVCGRHLSWFLNYLDKQHGEGVAVVAQLRRGA